ncbi:MAG: EAL domain-containing protein [Clostridia bacterium]
MDFLNEYKEIIIEVLKIVVIAIISILLYMLCTRGNRKKEKKVRKQAYTDELTGKGNRYLLYLDLDRLIDQEKNIAVCFMDLDSFKQINDALGHEAGDEVLKEIANKFDEALPNNAKAYRLGGDEFAIVIDQISTKEEVIRILESLKAVMSKPVIIDNNTISIEYSLGVVVSIDEKYSRKDLINYADNAMYYIKDHGGNDYYFHNESLKAKFENNIKMEKDLKHAYENNEFGIDLQPRINVNDTSKVGFEALLTWNHSVLGSLDAAYFITQAEAMGLTIKLDEYVLKAVCEKIIDFKNKGYDNVQIAVNISNKNAFKKEFIDTICDIISSYELPEKSLQIEMTGNLETNRLETYKVMFERLKEVGVDVIINNFEIRQESLELFAELPIDEVKISSNILSSENIDEKVFSDLIKLSKDLGYKVIVGKVNDDRKLVKAITNNADKIQGNFLFKKMDESLAEEVLANYGTYRLRIEEIIINAKKMY